VFVALVKQHAISICHTAVCGLSNCVIFFTLSPKGHNFLKKALGHKMYVLISSKIFVGKIFNSKKQLSQI
jgi:hypothetical protein